MAAGSSARTLAFIRKDLLEVLRQPRLVLTLVLGPFLILLAFGLGFAADPPPLKTVIVVPPDEPETLSSEAIAEELGPGIELVGTLPELEPALAQIEAGEADVAVVIPRDVEGTIRSDEHPQIDIYHNRIDPIEVSFLRFVALVAVEEVNDEVLARVIDEMQVSLEESAPEVALTDQPSSDIVVSPFVPRLHHVDDVEIDYAQFYVPGVVALLLQHLALTFAALSLVRERSLGAVDLFRVSPLSAGEALLGKYLAYLVLGALVGASLTLAAQFWIGFEIKGDWLWYALVGLLILMSALGAGFVTSAIARTESEAIQYSMIMLLIAMFFSGFVISLDRLTGPVRAISYLIPATYGITAMQDVAFNGNPPQMSSLMGMALLAAGFLLAAWQLVRYRVMGPFRSNGTRFGRTDTG
jgi:ABC-2 type transport system permease protein